MSPSRRNLQKGVISGRHRGQRWGCWERPVLRRKLAILRQVAAHGAFPHRAGDRDIQQLIKRGFVRISRGLGHEAWSGGYNIRRSVIRLTDLGMAYLARSL